MIIAQNNVELISIKTKSLEEFDSLPENHDIKQIKRNRKLNYSHINENLEFSSDPLNEHNEEEAYDDHYESSVRFIKINKSPNGACGFHLTRTKWDPYPWVSAIDDFTPAAKSDLKAGDCVLEVNGCDVLGLRITEIAKLVKSSQHHVTLLLWSTNCNTKCDEESLCAAPMPRSLQRLSVVVQMILGLIECPVCLDTITPPAMQCQNGHLLCVNCRIRAEKCPVCRDRYYPRPALIAEQIQSAITSAFNLCRNEDKVRQKIFGRHNRQRQMVKTTLHSMQQKQEQQHKSLMLDTLEKNENSLDVTTAIATTEYDVKCDRKVIDKFFKCSRSRSSSSSRNETKCNKFLTKLLNSKAYSMENLTNGHNNTNTIATTTTANNNIFNTCHTKTKITSAISQPQLFNMQQQQQLNNSHDIEGDCKTLFQDYTTRLPIDIQQQTLSTPSSLSECNTNQFNDFQRNNLRNRNIVDNLHLNTKLCCKQISNNNKLKPFSISSNADLRTKSKESSCIFESNNLQFINGSKRPQLPATAPVVICETSYATIPRAIKLKHQTMCQNDIQQSSKETSSVVMATNFSKSYSSSMTSLNLSLTTPCSCNCSCSCCSTASTSSLVTQNCQSSFS
ncbi:uncharacterized protein ACRADG_000264 isoform 1-T4 [Cochliomyia hominivorax]